MRERAISRRMQKPNERAYVARVTRLGGNARGSVVFYAVVADSKVAAAAAVRDAVRPDDYVELTDGMLSPETAQALGLRRGVAKAM